MKNKGGCLLLCNDRITVKMSTVRYHVISSDSSLLIYKGRSWLCCNKVCATFLQVSRLMKVQTTVFGLLLVTSSACVFVQGRQILAIFCEGQEQMAIIKYIRNIQPMLKQYLTKLREVWLNIKIEHCEMLSLCRYWSTARSFPATLIKLYISYWVYVSVVHKVIKYNSTKYMLNPASNTIETPLPTIHCNVYNPKIFVMIKLFTL